MEASDLKYYNKGKQSPPPNHIISNVRVTAFDPSGPQKLDLSGRLIN